MISVSNEWPFHRHVIYDARIWKIAGIVSTSSNCDWAVLEDDKTAECWDLDDVFQHGTWFPTREAAAAHLETLSNE